MSNEKSLRDIQQATKPPIEAIAQEQLSGAMMEGFGDFLDFLQDEKIRLSWKAINGYKATYKGKGIAGITLGAGGWLDNAVERKNTVTMHIATSDRVNLDADDYLEGQTDEVVALFMERFDHKCVHCRPTCGCSKGSGMNVTIAGKEYEHVCRNAPAVGFTCSGGDMSEMTLNSPCAVYPPIPIRTVPIETVKNLIKARKQYIEKML